MLDSHGKVFTRNARTRQEDVSDRFVDYDLACRRSCSSVIAYRYLFQRGIFGDYFPDTFHGAVRNEHHPPYSGKEHKVLLLGVVFDTLSLHDDVLHLDLHSLAETQESVSASCQSTRGASSWTRQERLLVWVLTLPQGLR